MESFHGGDVYRNRVQYDFSININPLGMPVGCVEAAKQSVASCTRYPDWRGEELCLALAEAEGVRAEQILLGNGAAELLYTFMSCLRPKRVLFPVPAFVEYEAAVTAFGGSCDFWEMREQADFRLEEAFLDAIREVTDLVILCNPNNPVGSVIKKELLLQIAEKCEKTNTWLCVDECFLPFAKEEKELTGKHSLEAFPHLIVLRAFTKIYGMPGLRLGYAMTADKEALERFRRCLQPWNTSIPAQAAGIQALRAKDFVEQTVNLVGKERAFLCENLADLPPEIVDKIYPSEANFIFLRSRIDLYTRMLEQGFLIRNCRDYRGLLSEREGLAGYFRIAVKTHEENQAILDAMRRLR
ncbi:MAG: aminotransferase class I/II-fold pyridoxal phosphate-dependent enzyme [Candidatus Gastranaerophilales bacterium]|nr:aminotransferase class I/II-fold pyridoxal phosphate-dependent enzyme [Candidatus Gastranaerophilales bacterium]